MTWSVTPAFEDANHEPVVDVEGPLNIAVQAGETVELSGAANDPDGDAVAITWWQYVEAGSYPGEVPLSNATARTMRLQVPADARPGDTIHLILEATDNGTPSLTRYKRVILTAEAR